jgi:hypothetical protein
MLRQVDDHGVKYESLMFVCPCSSYLHMLPVNTTATSPAWTMTGDVDAPTISPSILTRWGKEPEHVCHSFLEAGVFRFLDDCTHQFAGQQVPMPDLPDWVLDESVVD